MATKSTNLLPKHMCLNAFFNCKADDKKTVSSNQISNLSNINGLIHQKTKLDFIPDENTFSDFGAHGNNKFFIPKPTLEDDRKNKFKRKLILIIF